MIRIGTRGSALALAQTRLVADRLGADVAVEVIRTAGDASDRPLRELGDGVFVRAIEDALRAGSIDLAVHSLKDLPIEEPENLVIAAIPAREDPRDVIVTRLRGGLKTLPPAAVVGTSSPRRAEFVRALRPDLIVRDIRGNVDTRLRKVRDGGYDAVVVAAAGLRRLGIAFDELEALPIDLCPPAPGQGALALQVRASDRALRSRLAAIDDEDTRVSVHAERATLRAMGGSCDIALGTFARRAGGEIRLDAALATPGGVRRAGAQGRDPDEVASLVASRLGEPVRA